MYETHSKINCGLRRVRRITGTRPITGTSSELPERDQNYREEVRITGKRSELPKRNQNYRNESKVPLVKEQFLQMKLRSGFDQLLRSDFVIGTHCLCTHFWHLEQLIVSR